MNGNTSWEVPPGLRVLVTAGASGIGRTIADAFADAKARLHICDVSAEALERCRSERPSYGLTLCDVAEDGQVRKLFDDVAATLGGLDVLVNNAGIAGPTARVEAIDPADWRRTIDVNLNGHFYCTRLATPLLKKSAHGAIINISSVAGRLGYAFRTPYAASKWAIVGFTQSLAKELGPDGIRVNAILPGLVEGPRIERVIAARAQELGVAYEEAEQQYLSKISLRRMVTAQDIAGMALFLCSSLGRHVSGQALSVCAGVEAL